MLTRDQKKAAVAEFTDKFSRATGVFVADYRGLSVEAVNQLRGQIRGAGEGTGEYHVAKNTLLRLACDQSGTEGLKEYLTGPTAVAISYGDPVGVAKVLVKYASDHEVFEIRGGLLEGQAIDEAGVAKLATLPTLLELRGKLAGLIQAPATKLVRLLKEPGGQLARLLEARRASLEE